MTTSTPPSVPLLERVASAALEVAISNSPRWYLGARWGYRLMRLASSLAPVVAARGDFPRFLRAQLERDASTLLRMVEDWRRIVDGWRASPFLCHWCGAPIDAAQPGPCAACPTDVREEVQRAIEREAVELHDALG